MVVIDVLRASTTIISALAHGAAGVRPVLTVEAARALAASRGPDSTMLLGGERGGRRIDGEGVLTIEAHRYRTRERNREDARERLVALIQRAAHRPKPRVATNPTRAAKERRLASKRATGTIKRLRGLLQTAKAPKNSPPAAWVGLCLAISVESDGEYNKVKRYMPTIGKPSGALAASVPAGHTGADEEIPF